MKLPKGWWCWGICLLLSACLFDENFAVESGADEAEPGMVALGQGGTADGEPLVTTGVAGAEVWLGMAPPPLDFAAREQAAFAVVGDRLFVFGGRDEFGNELNSAAFYDPNDDRWEMVELADTTPNPRVSSSAVAVDGGVLVFGGETGARCAYGVAGARYDLVLGTWQPLPPAWTSRIGALTATDGVRTAFYGGTSPEGRPVPGGEVFNGASFSWEWMSSWGAPTITEGTLAISAASDLWIFGGRDAAGAVRPLASRFDLTNNTWTMLESGLVPRSHAFGAWDGEHLYIWGGNTADGVTNEGLRYAQGWMPMPAAQPPEGRTSEPGRFGWGFAIRPDEVAFLGGIDASGQVRHDGVRYVRKSESWYTIPPWPSGEDHRDGIGLWVKNQFILFGGRTGDRLTLTGERYRP